jgi:ankyrin repeat protein
MKYYAAALCFSLFLIDVAAHAAPHRECGTGYPYKTPQDTLEDAIKSHDIQMIQNALQVSGVRLNFSPRDSIDCAPPLFDAVDEDQADVIRLLIQRGADVNAKMFTNEFRGETESFSALMWAARNGKTNSALELLTYSNLDLNASGKHNETALYLAIRGLHYEIATLIADRPDANVNTVERCTSGEVPNTTPLILLIRNFPEFVDLNLLKTLAKKSGPFINSGQTLQTPLDAAIHTYDQGILDALFVSQELNPFVAVRKDGRSGLDEAIWIDNADAVRKIIARPGLPNGLLESLVINFPKTSAVVSTYASAFAALFESPLLDPNAIDANGRSLLERYANEPRYVLPLLKSSKIDVNINNGGPLKAAKAALAACSRIKGPNYCVELESYVAALEALGAH